MTSGAMDSGANSIIYTTSFCQVTHATTSTTAAPAVSISTRPEDYSSPPGSGVNRDGISGYSGGYPTTSTVGVSQLGVNFVATETPGCSQSVAGNGGNLIVHTNHLPSHPFPKTTRPYAAVTTGMPSVPGCSPVTTSVIGLQPIGSGIGSQLPASRQPGDRVMNFQPTSSPQMSNLLRFGQVSAAPGGFSNGSPLITTEPYINGLGAGLTGVPPTGLSVSNPHLAYYQPNVGPFYPPGSLPLLGQGMVYPHAGMLLNNIANSQYMQTSFHPQAGGWNGIPVSKPTQFAGFYPGQYYPVTPPHHLAIQGNHQGFQPYYLTGNNQHVEVNNQPVTQTVATLQPKTQCWASTHRL